MTRETHNRCADCGAPTASFLCDRCAEICDNLTVRGEYWFRRIKPVRKSVTTPVTDRNKGSARLR